MATDIVQLKVDGSPVYVETHADAVKGLSSVQGPKGEKGDIGPQGLKGDVGPKGEKGDPGQNATTTAVATQTADGLMSKEDKKKLDGLPSITLTKVGTV